MAKIKWTPAQQDAINARRGTVLVSAAAGSGKTAVLVERAIERLTDRENPSDANKLLIVTFTKAAAAEMRARLEKKLGEMLRENPRDENLRRQSILLSQANIGTVHSFCSELIREFFYALDIPQDFMIVTDKQEEEMREEAVSEILSEAFETDEFELLADVFTGERNDRQLINIILGLYRYMQSHPFPQKWLESKIAMFKSAGKAAETPWGEIVIDFTQEALTYCLNALEDALDTVSLESELDAAYTPALENDLEKIEELIRLTESRDWNDIYNAIYSFKFVSRGRVTETPKDDPAFLKAELIRKNIKDIVQKKLPTLYVSDEFGCKEEFAEVAKITEKLAELIYRFEARYSEKKLEHNFLDYNDLEHYALKLLVDSNGEKTQVASEISERFDEIMIDEFQDVNDVQDYIFKAVSNGENIFMVGDVKQSIYSFRCAVPDIFIRNRESFEKYDNALDNYPSYVVLDRNYRSRKEVTDSVNFVFSQLLRKDTGDIDYTDEESLVNAADYPECDDKNRDKNKDFSDGYDTEIDVLKKEENTPDEELEARFIAKRIKEIIESGLEITDGKEQRKVTYRDFTVLLRSANKYAHTYAKILEENNVPAKSSVTGGFFDTREIGTVLSFLRVIDNPNQDIPLLSVLMSPVYGFTPDDMAKLRLEDKEVPIYISVVRAAESDERYKKVIEDIANYRAVSATMPSDVFISYLYTKTSYTNIVLAMNDGENRLANLHLLEKHARDYENSGYNGLSGFVRFIDRMHQNNADMQSAEVVGDSSNRVNIMSIHKSKGLEFPVCIIAGCGRGINRRKDEIILHPDLGLGMKIRDNKLAARYTTMSREAISLDTDKKTSAEELRILYVAMTRAREKLIMIGTDKDPEKLVTKLSAQVTHRGISSYSITTAKGFLEWILLCALRHPDAENLRNIVDARENIVDRNNYTKMSVCISPECDLEEIEVVSKEEIALPSEDMLKRLKTDIDYVYPYSELSRIPLKVSASGLASKEHADEYKRTLSRPSWLGAKGMTPAERGTALHDFMQYADFAVASSEPEKELDRLAQDGFITQEQASAVDLKKVKAFFNSELGKRVIGSNMVEKEKRFTAEITAFDADNTVSERYRNHPVILQGAVDCIFEESGKLNIIDFKTDRIDDISELVDMYKVQLNLYRKAMEQVAGMDIADCYIYSMHSGKFIRVD